MTEGEYRNIAINDILQCSICSQTLRQPKCLPCIHTFCLECLYDRARVDHNDYGLVCPLCDTVFNFKLEGLEELPTNFLAEQLLQQSLFAEIISGAVKVPCEVCNTSSGTHEQLDSTATSYCVNCGQYLCATCRTCHQKITVTKSHTVVTLEEMRVNETLQRIRVIYCNEHVGRPLELYCCPCKAVICMKCLTVDHVGHAYSNLIEAATNLSRKLREDRGKLNSSMIAENQKLDWRRDKFQEQILLARSKLNTKYELAKQRLKAEHEEHAEKLQQIETERLREFASLKKTRESCIEVIKDFKEYSEYLLTVGTPCVISLCGDYLISRAKELIQLQESITGGCNKPDGFVSDLPTETLFVGDELLGSAGLSCKSSKIILITFSYN